MPLNKETKPNQTNNIYISWLMFIRFAVDRREIFSKSSYLLYIFTSPSARAGYDTRSIF